MSPIPSRDRGLELSGIGKIAAGALDDPEVIPLWFGESDLVTPAVHPRGRQAALDEGRTFYNYSARHSPLREALQRYHDRIYGIDLHPDRITSSGSTMLTVVIAVQCLAGRGDEVILIGPYWPNMRTGLHHAGAAACRRPPGRGRRPLASRPRRRGARDHARGPRPSTSTARPTRPAG